MEERIALYHPDLKETTEALTEEQAAVFEQSGWTREVPRKYQTDEKKEA